MKFYLVLITNSDMSGPDLNCHYSCDCVTVTGKNKFCLEISHSDYFDVNVKFTLSSAVIYNPSLTNYPTCYMFIECSIYN